MNSINKINSLTLPTLAVALAMTAGCASGPDRVADDFGNSVRAMRQAQTMNAVVPDTTTITSTDGQRMENALQSYRESVGQPAAVQDSFDFKVGN